MMVKIDVETDVRQHLTMLAEKIGSRPVGAQANQRTQRYIALMFETAGYELETQSFDCIDWKHQGTEVRLGDVSLAAWANPFSPPCEVTAPFVAVENLADLEVSDLTRRIVLLHGALAAEPLFPRNFPFFQVEAHQALLNLLDAKRPEAVVLVNPQAGSTAPMMEDGDFGIPSVTLAAEAGAALLARPNSELSVCVNTALHPSTGANVIARSPGRLGKKVVVCAHYDTKYDTSGALDNAAGVSALLALAQVLAEWRGDLGLEFLAFNGEEHYAAPGQVAYLERYGTEFPSIVLAINVDGVGLKNQNNSVAFFACPNDLEESIRQRMRRVPHLVEREPWPQGDHTLFWPQGVPSIAFTSETVGVQIENLIHSSSDTVGQVSVPSIVEVVEFISETVRSL
jgi:aminopeptidase YwaD